MDDSCGCDEFFGALAVCRCCVEGEEDLLWFTRSAGEICGLHVDAEQFPNGGVPDELDDCGVVDEEWQWGVAEHRDVEDSHVS